MTIGVENDNFAKYCLNTHTRTHTNTHTHTHTFLFVLIVVFISEFFKIHKEQYIILIITTTTKIHHIILQNEMNQYCYFAALKFIYM